MERDKPSWGCFWRLDVNMRTGRDVKENEREESMVCFAGQSVLCEETRK